MRQDDTAKPETAVREEALAWLALLRGDPTLEDQKAFLAWYDKHPSHADTYDDVLANWEGMGIVANDPKQQSHDRSFLAANTRLLPLAACVALIFAGMCYYVLRGADIIAPASTGRSQLASKIGEIRTLSLPDGSRLILDTNSLVSVNYGADKRRLTLVRGRARFEVAHEAGRPFIVDADGIEVIAHGTAFDIDLQGSRPSVALLHGSIEVRSRAHPSLRHVLQAGQQTLISSESAPLPPVAFDKALGRWPAGMLSFVDMPLLDVVTAVNRYTKTPITVADNTGLAALRFTGTLRIDDAHATARILAKTFQLTLAPDKQGRLLLTRTPSLKKPPG